VPGLDKLSEVPHRRLEALQHLRIAPDKPITESVTRGQYQDYRQQVSNPKSTVETYVSLTLESTDPRWQGVPITLATGKAMQDKFTEIRITYKQDGQHEANELILRLQPDEGVEMCMWSKRPGYERQVDKRSLRFSYQTNERLPEAYERVFLDTIRSDRTLFVSNEEVLETWRILTPVQEAWKMNDTDLIFYPSGSDINSL